MNFNNSQLATIEKLIDDRVYFLKENIFYCQNDIDYYSKSNPLKKLIYLNITIKLQMQVHN